MVKYVIKYIYHNKKFIFSILFILFFLNQLFSTDIISNVFRKEFFNSNDLKNIDTFINNKRVFQTSQSNDAAYIFKINNFYLKIVFHKMLQNYIFYYNLYS